MYYSNYSSSGSPSSSPISIGSSSASSASSTSSTSSTFSQREDNYAKGLSCAFPSWPKGDAFRTFHSGVPSSCFSDAELFADDLQTDADVPLLREAPAPPRMQPVVAMPLLPLYASEKPKKKRRSSRKQSRPAKPMTPIAESPATGG